MKISDFNSLWYSAFGWKLSESGGVDEWASWIDTPKSNDRAIRETLKTFSQAYTEAKEKGKSNYRDIVPTVDEFKKRYFALMPDLKRKWDAEAHGGVKLDGRCLVCGGGGKVFALAPAKGDPDRQQAPEDWRTITAERLYYGVEIYPCPLCREGEYHGNHNLRNRVMNNSLPEIVPSSHKDNPYGGKCGGDYIILNAIRERLGGNAVLPRDNSFRQSFTPEELKREERYVSREIAAYFNDEEPDEYPAQPEYGDFGGEETEVIM